MMRRRFVHILLSLLLLVSQQMAVAHAMSHWTGKLGVSNPVTAVLRADAESDLSSAVALDQSCSQCLAFAQMAGAPGGTARQFSLLDLQTERVAAPANGLAAARTVCVFQSRAPPAFV